MPADLTMPKLSDSEADIVIVRWLKAPGEGFRRGEALMEVETDKATVVSEAEDDGTLEAMEDPGAAFRLAVQWHPETGQDARLFEALVAACR